MLYRVLNGFIRLFDEWFLLFDILWVLKCSWVYQSIIDSSIEFKDDIRQNKHCVLEVWYHSIQSNLNFQVLTLEGDARYGQCLGVFSLTVHPWGVFNKLAVNVERVWFKEHDVGPICDWDVHQELRRLAGVHVDLNRVESNFLKEFGCCDDRQRCILASQLTSRRLSLSQGNVRD